MAINKNAVNDILISYPMISERFIIHANAKKFYLGKNNQWNTGIQLPVTHTR